MNHEHDDEFAELADLNDEPMPTWTPRTEPSEGVRILGAAVTGETPAVARRDETPPSWSASAQGLVPEPVHPAEDIPDIAGARPAANIDEPITGEYAIDEEEMLSGYAARSAPSNEFESVEPVHVASEPSDVELPHWSEPATGAIPQVLIDGGAEERSTGSTPRFRNSPGDWEDDSGFASLDEEDAVRPEPVSATPRAGARSRARQRSGGGAVRPPVQQSSSGGRDLPTAIATGIVLAVVGFICLMTGGFAAAIVVGAVAFLCAYEFFDGLRLAGMRSVPATLLCLFGSAAMPMAVAWKGLSAALVVFVVVLWAMFLWYLLGIGGGRPVLSMGSSMLGFAYIGGMAAFGGQFVYGGKSYSTKALLGIVLCVAAADAVGYFVGSNIGKTPLSPRISPNKTLEGLLGGLLGSIVVGIIVSFTIDAWSGVSHGILLGLVVGIMGPFGDLSESMLKRDLGIKDFGSVLPGHGGVLDRFDAMLFCLPACWFLYTALL
ncbi:MAG: phosphatidate cytidylyltransferase [Acidimicrobiia bacterium]